MMMLARAVSVILQISSSGYGYSRRPILLDPVNRNAVVVNQATRILVQMFDKIRIRVEPPEGRPADHEILISLLSKSSQLLYSALAIGWWSPVQAVFFDKGPHGTRLESVCRIPFTAINKNNIVVRTNNAFDIGNRLLQLVKPRMLPPFCRIHEYAITSERVGERSTLLFVALQFDIELLAKRARRIVILPMQSIATLRLDDRLHTSKCRGQIVQIIVGAEPEHILRNWHDTLEKCARPGISRRRR